MNIGSAIVVFVLIWWCVFFVMLPLGVQSGWEAEKQGGEAPPAGADPGAPTDPKLKQKAIRTTGVTFVLWLITLLIIQSGLINFRS